MCVGASIDTDVCVYAGEAEEAFDDLEVNFNGTVKRVRMPLWRSLMWRVWVSEQLGIERPLLLAESRIRGTWSA